MNPQSPRTAAPIFRAVILLQLKLLLGAARDLVLIPLALVAAAFDIALLKDHAPQFLRTVLRFGENTDHWIDMWSGARDAQSPQRENVDTLLARVEEVVRDPQTGARRARVLKRWAERQIARARERAALQVQARMTSESQRRPSPPDGGE